MELDQIVDKVVDQNEIESRYIWICARGAPTNGILRINLSRLAMDLYEPLKNMHWAQHCVALPNDKVFGVSLEFSEQNPNIKHRFISDRYFNVEFVISPTSEEIYKESIILSSCFYDDWIFIFEHNWKVVQKFGFYPHCFKKYSLSQKQWVNLTNPPLTFPNACIGFNQKIIIADKNQAIWVYDINLDSYSKFFVNISEDESLKILIKNSGTIYLIIQSYPYRVYICNGNLSEWALICESKNKLYQLSDNSYNIFYEDSIYYTSQKEIYKFDLKNSESKYMSVKVNIKIRH